MRITPHLAATRFGACSPVPTTTGVFVLLLLWASAPRAEEITGQALESALQNQGWEVQHQPDGSSLVLPPEQTGKEFVFREPTPEEQAQATTDNPAAEKQPEESPPVPPTAESGIETEAAKPGQAVAPAIPAKTTTPAKTHPTASLYPAQPGYSRAGPRRHWRNRYPYRSRAWQRYRQHRGARHPWRGYGYRRGPRYGYSPYYAPPYGSGAPVE